MSILPDTSGTADRAAAQIRDAELVARIRAGDANALGELMQHYALQLTAVSSAVLGSDDLVEDVVHDVFLSLWEHRGALHMRRNVAGYLHRAVRNRSLNVLRQERSQRRISDEAAERDFDVPRVAENYAERMLEHADVDARLRSALRHVSPSPREVFLLSWDAGLTYEEIAELLGITTRSVAQQMYRATQRLATYLPHDPF